MYRVSLQVHLTCIFLQDELSLLFENSDVPSCQQMWVFWIDLFHTSQLMSRPFE